MSHNLASPCLEQNEASPMNTIDDRTPREQETREQMNCHTDGLALGQAAKGNEETWNSETKKFETN